ncbi:hypothetical protein BDAG_03495 [Burkholderia dolosa AU0158]|nr:hypothetical protein BDAG_03495 [Burkholderia dolosa AU0158]
MRRANWPIAPAARRALPVAARRRSIRVNPKRVASVAQCASVRHFFTKSCFTPIPARRPPAAHAGRAARPPDDAARTGRPLRGARFLSRPRAARHRRGPHRRQHPVARDAARVRAVRRGRGVRVPRRVRDRNRLQLACRAARRSRRAPALHPARVRDLSRIPRDGRPDAADHGRAERVRDRRAQHADQRSRRAAAQAARGAARHPAVPPSAVPRIGAADVRVLRAARAARTAARAHAAVAAARVQRVAVVRGAARRAVPADRRRRAVGLQSVRVAVPVRVRRDRALPARLSDARAEAAGLAADGRVARDRRGRRVLPAAHRAVPDRSVDQAEPRRAAAREFSGDRMARREARAPRLDEEGRARDAVDRHDRPAGAAVLRRRHRHLARGRLAAVPGDGRLDVPLGLTADVVAMALLYLVAKLYGPFVARLPFRSRR